jgi:hypothetical protein
LHDETVKALAMPEVRSKFDELVAKPIAVAELVGFASAQPTLARASG